MSYLVLAFYLIEPIQIPLKAIENFKRFMDSHDMRGRIYINEQGINAQLSILKTQAPLFLDWYLSKEPFDRTKKIHQSPYFEHAFPKKTVKYRRELVALGQSVDHSKRATPVSPKEWEQMLSKNRENTLILDVRNDYEWEVGHFEGAQRPTCRTFSTFSPLSNQIEKKFDTQKTKIFMYCTGGIRCEFYSSLIKARGYHHVYQLEGGVINYGKEIGNRHWKGSLFVFDDRLVTPICDEKSEMIAHCSFCNAKTESYYNCANLNCNALFLSCFSCYTGRLGCCSKGCAESGGKRSIRFHKKGKPFRKLSFEEKKWLRKL